MKRSKGKTSSNTILAALNPTINVVVLITGLVVWAFQTFAQISYVKEQNAQLISLVEQRHKDAVEHSDMNRDRMLSILNEMKELIKLVDMRVRDISTVKR
jgi:hypothetical protein